MTDSMTLTALVFNSLADRVASYCGSRGLSGVLTVCDLRSVVPTVFFANINRSSCLRIGVEGKRDLNYLAVAFSKLAVSVAHGTESGEERNIFGEVHFRGSYIDPTERFIYAFSGASEEEDLEIAKMAHQVHHSF
jgi:hypothetical protein